MQVDVENNGSMLVFNGTSFRYKHVYTFHRTKFEQLVLTTEIYARKLHDSVCEVS